MKFETALFLPDLEDRVFLIQDRNSKHNNKISYGLFEEIEKIFVKTSPEKILRIC